MLGRGADPVVGGRDDRRRVDHAAGELPVMRPGVTSPRLLVFHPWGWEDFTYWATADKKMLRRLLRLIEEARRTPFEGTGKPEPLRRNLSGFWSRRIDDEHRLVYGATDDDLIIIQARYHYDD
jgi:toxin YoeB